MGQGWKGAPPIGLGGRGQERAPGAPSCGSLPSPAALLSFCTSAGNVPLTYIFFQTYVTFFFFSPLWEETGENPKKKKRKKLEQCARENKEAFSKAPANSEHRHVRINSQGSPEPLLQPLRGSKTESVGNKDHAPRRGPERCPGSSRLTNPCSS